MFKHICAKQKRRSEFFCCTKHQNDYLIDTCIFATLLQNGHIRPNAASLLRQFGYFSVLLSGHLLEARYRFGITVLHQNVFL